MSSTSRQDQRAASAEEDGEAQAQRAGEQTREIAHERTERARVVGAGAGGHDEETEAQAQRQPTEERRHRAGILETVQQGARSLVSAVGRTLGVARDTTADKTGEYKDCCSADKAIQAGGATAQKAGEYKDHATDKATAAKDAAAQKASEAAEATEGKLSEYKDYAADKATGMKDAAAQKASETAEMAKKRLVEYKDSAAQAAKETKDAAAEKAEELSKAARDDERTMEEDTTRASHSPEEKLEAMEYLTLRTEEAKEQSKVGDERADRAGGGERVALEGWQVKDTGA